MHIEIDNSQAVISTPTKLTQVLILGQAAVRDGKVDGSGAINTPVRITHAYHAATLWVQGSMLAEMVREFLTDNSDAGLIVMVQGNGVGKADAGSLTLSSQEQQDWVLNVYLGGVRIRVTIEKGQHGKAVGDALAQAIKAMPSLPSLPVTAVSTVPGGENVNADERVVTLAAPAAWVTNPDLANSIAALGDTQYHHIVMPWLNTANLTLLSAALCNR